MENIIFKKFKVVNIVNVDVKYIVIYVKNISGVTYVIILISSIINYNIKMYNKLSVWNVKKYNLQVKNVLNVTNYLQHIGVKNVKYYN